MMIQLTTHSVRNKTTDPPQGYHVQITARSDTDLEPATILQKVSDASGAKYTAGGSAPAKPSGPPPPVKTKPLFAGVSGPTNPIIAARNANLKKKDDDEEESERARSLYAVYAVKVERSHHVAGDFGLPPAVFFSLSPPIHVHLNLVKFQTFLRPDTKRFLLL